VGRIFKEMSQYFQADEWVVEKLDGKTTLVMEFVGEKAAWECHAEARDDAEQFVFYSLAPFDVPAEYRPAMSEFITRANSGMVIGNFELDFSNGLVRFKTSLDLEGTPLSYPLAYYAVWANIRAMNDYLPGLLAVGVAGMSPLVAIAAVEDAS